MTFQGTIADINAALEGSTYTPTPNFNGSVVLSVLANDMGNTGGGGNGTDLESVSIDVVAVNDAPVLDNSTNPQFDTINEDDVNNAGETVAIR
jgi:hypothetical protein